MIFLLQQNMGFSDCEDFPATHTINLEPNGQTVFPLSATKFSRVDTLTIYVQDNHGGDISALSRVRLTGTNMEGFDVSNIKKCWYVICLSRHWTDIVILLLILFILLIVACFIIICCGLQRCVGRVWGCGKRTLLVFVPCHYSSAAESDNADTHNDNDVYMSLCTKYDNGQ